MPMAAEHQVSVTVGMRVLILLAIWKRVRVLVIVHQPLPPLASMCMHSPHAITVRVPMHMQPVFWRPSAPSLMH